MIRVEREVYDQLYYLDNASSVGWMYQTPFKAQGEILHYCWRVKFHNAEERCCSKIHTDWTRALKQLLSNFSPHKQRGLLNCCKNI